MNMSDSKKTEKGPALNPAMALTAVGLGVVLAPFTGGASLLYSAGCIGTYAAVDVATGGKSL